MVKLVRFYEISNIPIYVWDDIEWLPYKTNRCNKFCISINIKDIDKLEDILNNI